MRLRRWKRYGIGAGGILVLVAAMLLATGWGSAVAAQITSVFVTNDSAHPVPVQEQRTDANGNIRVHEQGTANVNVTNGSLNVASPAPIMGGGSVTSLSGGDPGVAVLNPQTASALEIHMTAGVSYLTLGLSGATPAAFTGPNRGGLADIVLALDRPIKFDHVYCVSDASSGESCSVSWVGASP
jgi:hypothetical protein